jgi:phosphate transport system permease protein
MATTPIPAPKSLAGPRIRPGDLFLRVLTLVAALAAVALVAGIVWEVGRLAKPAIEKYGASFITDTTWNPVTNTFGARNFILGTLISSVGALVIAAPLGVAIAIYLNQYAPRWIRNTLGTLIEMLAAIPSVALGLWGILVLGPWVASSLEPWLNRYLGFLQIFSGQASPLGMLPAILILTLMILPIVSSVSREIISSAPRELSDGSLALGSTQWESIRGVLLPYARPGIVAASILGLARAFGEAIAVTQVIGGANAVSRSLFAPSDTLASRVASQYQGAATDLQVASIAYLAVILLVISLLVNTLARVIIYVSQRRLGGVAR